MKHLNIFLDKVNAIDRNIQFMLEIVQHGKLSALDVKLIKHSDNQTTENKIYRNCTIK